MSSAVVTLPKRSEVPVADTWDAAAIFANDVLRRSNVSLYAMYAGKFMRSTIAPEMSAAVMMQNVPW